MVIKIKQNVLVSYDIYQYNNNITWNKKLFS